MRKILSLLITTLVSLPAVQAQSSGSTNSANLMGQPFIAGNQGLFTTALVNLNLANFFSGLSEGGSAIRSNGIFAPQYSGLRANQVENIRLSSFGSPRLADATATTVIGSSSGSQLYIVMTGLENSQNLRAASTGLVFSTSNSTPVQSIAFQYSPLSSQTGTAINDINQAPFLAITDQNGARTRLLPVTSGLLASNASLNQFSNAFGSANSSSAGSGTSTNGNTTSNREIGTVSSASVSNFTTADALNAGFLTVAFTPAQLKTQGKVTSIGLVYGKTGIVLINGLTVNGASVASFSADVISGFPFSGSFQY